jgi:hypothetical protein
MLCKRGRWDDRLAPGENAVRPPFRRFVMSASGIEAAQWRQMEELADQWLGESNRSGG